MALSQAPEFLREPYILWSSIFERVLQETEAMVEHLTGSRRLEDCDQYSG